MNSKLSKINFQELQDLKNKEEYIFINFDYSYSIKIIPFFEKINIKEKDSLVDFFFHLTNTNVRIDDLLGKLHLILLKILVDGERNLVINSIGFSENSIEFLTDNMIKILDYFDNKNLIIIENSSHEPFKFNYSG
ncbi:hypothetical protein DBR39_00125 [Chryseobacterium sp. KBW03]|uniref:hypothetical protein n=1 Tax=Chryseobacterium sp. KBW03 TaxID=2153362 RepID=UPI000F5A93D3|nr:hypothetical protein [Chryseobacterium sp. KBW03]RQO42318.1 hypothetical protein DBR39_00125 [Chryseobacterium sp. KBW03]